MANAPKPIIVDGVAYQLQADGSYAAVTPEKQEKPVIVGGQAYEKQPDGTYKAVIEKAPEIITKTIKNVIYSSADGGLTWKNAMTGLPAPKLLLEAQALLLKLQQKHRQ